MQVCTQHASQRGRGPAAAAAAPPTLNPTPSLLLPSSPSQLLPSLSHAPCLTRSPAAGPQRASQARPGWQRTSPIKAPLNPPLFTLLLRPAQPSNRSIEPAASSPSTAATTRNEARPSPAGERGRAPPALHTLRLNPRPQKYTQQNDRSLLLAAPLHTEFPGWRSTLRVLRK